MPASDQTSLRTCGVRVPCSTSNLGAGFDCIGLAFDRYLDAGYIPGSAAFRVQRGGTLAALVDDDRDLLVAAFRAELSKHGMRNVGGTVLMTSQIPIGRGLGSSAAAVVAGIALATAARGATVDRAYVLAEAVRIEGHPDNAAPALYGGLIGIAFADHSTPYPMQLPLAPGVSFVFAAPDVEVSTQRARAALPQQVPHSAATRNLGRVAALLHGLAHADATAIAAGLHDELHVPYRLPLIPGAERAIKAAVNAGAWGATISGSGSGIIGVCPQGIETRVLDALLAAFHATAKSAAGFVATPDLHGVQPRDVLTLRTVMNV